VDTSSNIVHYKTDVLSDLCDGRLDIMMNTADEVSTTVVFHVVEFQLTDIHLQHTEARSNVTITRTPSRSV